MSPHIGITSDQFVEETTENFRNYNLNGITGSATIFRDFGLPPCRWNLSTIAIRRRMASISSRR